MKEIINRRKALKEKLKTRQSVFASWTSLGHPSIAEIFSKTGFDFTGIDVEHSTISQEQSQRIIAACQAEGSLCLPRIPTHDEAMIKRLLDSGADGIIVPNVNSKEHVEQIVQWMFYPPIGRRGFGIARAQGYGMDFDEYIKSWNESTVFIAQIESIAAVERIDEILDNKYLDGVMVGPYDISGSLGIPGQITHARVQEAGLRVVAAAKKFGKACGTHVIDTSVENVNQSFNNDYTFAVLSSDIFMLLDWSKQMQKIIKTPCPV